MISYEVSAGEYTSLLRFRQRSCYVSSDLVNETAIQLILNGESKGLFLFYVTGLKYHDDYIDAVVTSTRVVRLWLK